MPEVLQSPASRNLNQKSTTFLLEIKYGVPGMRECGMRECGIGMRNGMEYGMENENGMGMGMELCVGNCGIVCV